MNLCCPPAASQASSEAGRATGLSYYAYRYYNPTTGRWISRDPIGEAGGLKLYQFAKNHPLATRDYLGLVPQGVYTDQVDRIEEDEGRRNLLNQVRADLANGIWYSRDDAGSYGARAAAFLTLRGPRRIEGSVAVTVEYGGRVCCRCVEEGSKKVFEYSLTGPFTNLEHRQLRFLFYDQCPRDSREVGYYHSHPYPGGPSQGDREALLLREEINRRLDSHPCTQLHSQAKGYLAFVNVGKEVYGLIAFYGNSERVEQLQDVRPIPEPPISGPKS